MFEIQQPVSLFFNGKKLYIEDNIDNKIAYEFVARSGHSKSSLWEENSKNQIFAVDDPLYSIFNPMVYPMLNSIFKPKFYYDELSLCVEEGEYYISIPETYIKQNTNNKNSKGSKENNDKSSANNYVDNAKDNSMGNINNKYIAFKPIYSNENDYIKDYKIHGGENYESTYGINLYNKYNEFINSFYKLINQKNDDIYIKDYVAPIKLQVSYLLDIDLRANPSNPNGVKWQSQAGDKTGCKRACDKILNSAGIKRSGDKLTNYENIKINEGEKDTASVFILAVEKYREFKFKPGTSEVYKSGPKIIDDIKAKDSSFDETKQEIYLEPIPENLQYALEYIDSELEKGYPVLIGVDERFDKRIEDDEKRYNGPAYTTDHFVVIVGRKYDSNRVPKYIFYDVRTAHENKGASDENTLWVEGNFLKGKFDNRKYVVTEVRRNVR